MSISAAHQARANKVLDTQVRVNGGEFMTRRQLIEARVAAGAIVVNTKHSGRILQSPDGPFLDTRNITAIGLDYATQLIEAKA